MNKLLFACPGIPKSTNPYNTIEGIKQVANLGLDAMELEFVRRINVSKEKSEIVKKISKKHNVVLTTHGQYWVNLASLEKEKINASIKRIEEAATRAYECGAYSITWHFGFYMKRDKEKVYEIIKNNVKTVLKKLKDKGIKIWIRPETTGKATQWGDIDEVIKLSSELEQVLPCIDFSHLHARDGKNNSYKEFCDVLNKIEKLGKEAIKNMHMHLSGIAYGQKGEKHHLNLKESDMKYKELLKAFKDYNVKGVLVSESPNIEDDALMLKKAYKS